MAESMWVVAMGPLIVPTDPALRLRLLREEDARALYELVDGNRLHLRQWLPWVDNQAGPEDSRRFICSAVADFQNRQSAVMGIWLRDQVVGTCSLDAIDAIRRTAHIGYWLAEPYTGRGWMTACVKRLMEWGRAHYALNQLVINVAVGNRKSAAVAERLGFRHTRTVAQAEDLYGEWLDHKRYELKLAP